MAAGAGRGKTMTILAATARAALELAALASFITATLIWLPELMGV